MLTLESKTRETKIGFDGVNLPKVCDEGCSHSGCNDDPILVVVVQGCLESIGEVAGHVDSTPHVGYIKPNHNVVVWVGRSDKED